jgi:hypothetical protein
MKWITSALSNYVIELLFLVFEFQIELEKHLHDPQPIPKTIKNTFQVKKTFLRPGESWIWL